MAKQTNKWFKHYNTAHTGHLIGNLIAQKRYDCVALWWVILEFISQFESEEHRGMCTVPLARIAQAMNMNQSKIERLLVHISSVSHSDFVCEMSEKQTRNVTFRLRNWLELQESTSKKKRKKTAKTPREERRDTKVSQKIEAEEESHPPRSRFTLSSAERQEISMSPEATELRERLRPKYGMRLDFLVPDILGFWGGEQNFLSWVENKERTFDAKKTNHDLSNFVEICIKKELGLIA